jgi:hypothetical protein
MKNSSNNNLINRSERQPNGKNAVTILHNDLSVAVFLCIDIETEIHHVYISFSISPKQIDDELLFLLWIFIIMCLINKFIVASQTRHSASTFLFLALLSGLIFSAVQLSASRVSLILTWPGVSSHA